MVPASVMTSAPTGSPSKPSAGARRDSRPRAAWRARAPRARAPGPRGGRGRGAGRAGGVGGGKQIPPPIHAEHVAALARQLLEEIDAPVHARDHVVAGAPLPVSVCLRAHV